MGLLETEIKELREINRRITEKTIDREELIAHIAIYSKIENREKMIIQTHALGMKFGKPALNRLIKTQLIGDGSVVVLSNDDLENETIDCPDQNKLISRANCKQFSETTGNLGTCQTCPYFLATRKLLNSIRQPVIEGTAA